MVKLAENQYGGLPFGDRLVTAGTVPDRFRLWLVGLCFEQRYLLAYSRAAVSRSRTYMPRSVNSRASSSYRAGSELPPRPDCRPVN
jgi:hypothetical protein